MGIIRAGVFMDEAGNKQAYQIVWGKVTLDAKTSMSRNGNRKAFFNLKIHHNPKTFCDCVVWGSSLAGDIAASLEKGDIVLAIGKWAERPYTNKAGEARTLCELTCDFVIPESSLAFIFRALGSDSLNKMLDNDDAVMSDRMESEGDFEGSGAGDDYVLGM